MNKVEHYQTLILRFLSHYVKKSVTLETNLIHDEKKMCYQVHESGWESGYAYYFNVLLHLQVKPDGKIWIYENRTELDIADMLYNDGVEKKDIVLNFIPENIRSLTGYAAA